MLKEKLHLHTVLKNAMRLRVSMNETALILVTLAKLLYDIYFLAFKSFVTYISMMISKLFKKDLASSYTLV